MIGCSLGKVILFINYLPYLATSFPFSRFLLLLIFFKTALSEFSAGKSYFAVSSETGACITQVAFS